MTADPAPLLLPQPEDPYDRVIDPWKVAARFLAQWPLLLAGLVGGAVIGAIVSASSTTLYDGVGLLRIANRVELTITPAVRASYRALAGDATVLQHAVSEIAGAGSSSFPDLAVTTRMGDAANVIEVLVRLPDPALAQRAATAAAKRTVELASAQIKALNSPVTAQVDLATGSADKLVAEREQELLDFLNRPRPESMSQAAHDEQRRLLQGRLASAEMLRNRIGDASGPALRDLVQPPYMLEYIDQPSAVARRASPTVLALAVRGGVSGLVVVIALLAGYWLLAAARLRAKS